MNEVRIIILKGKSNKFNFTKLNIYSFLHNLGPIGIKRYLQNVVEATDGLALTNYILK